LNIVGGTENYMLKNRISKLVSHKKLKSRSGRVFVNLSASVVFKMVNMVISFFMVPITLNYLDKTRYGLWAAISSLLAWFFIFDIGIGNGLRNKYTELKAKGRIEEAKAYVSTAYFIFGMLSIVFVTVFLLLNRLVDWAAVLNAPEIYRAELSQTVSITMLMLCMVFVFKLINTILAADFKNSISDGLTVISHVISFLGIIYLSKFTTPSILKYAVLYSGANLGVLIVASFILYSGHYKSIAPSLKSIDMSLAKELVSVGLRFFFIQIAAMALFQSTSFIISAFVNPVAVTDYNITQKYFSMVAMFFYMMSNPLWTGYGEAYHKGEYQWIKTTFSRLMKLWVFIVLALVIMLLMQNFVFQLWLRGRIEVDYILSILFIVNYALQMINAIYSPLINAAAKLKLSLIILPLTVVLFLGLSYVFTKILGLGAKGVLIALILAQGIPAAVLSPLQGYKILSGAKGIWNK